MIKNAANRWGQQIARAAFAVLAVLFIGRGATADVMRLEEITVPVSDITRTEKFFHRGLGFNTIARGVLAGEDFDRLVGINGARARFIKMRLGADEVVFVEYARSGKPYPAGSKSTDLWFQHFAVVVSDMDKAFARLRRVGVTPISEDGPVTLPPGNGSVKAFKFRDPDGHPLELLYFPADQGRAVWHRPTTGRIFLGIDHSAIGISNTERSAGFYRDLLGMKIAYHTLNLGPTQEQLDGTAGAVVQVTGLRPVSTAGPGIEFLDYQAPRTDRATVADTQSNDLVCLELTLAVDDLSAVVARLHTASVAFISPDIVEFSNGRRAAAVRDPDGHAVILDQETTRKLGANTLDR